MDINVRPNWKWTPAGSRSALPVGRGSAPSPSLLKQVLLPRSVDLNLSFALKYRR
jgi:hypothetical protein